MFDSPEPTCEAKSITLTDDSIRGRLVRNKQRAEASLQIINEALAALDANPEVAKVIELVNRAR